MIVFHQRAKRPESIGGPRTKVIRKKLAEALDVIDQVSKVPLCAYHIHAKDDDDSSNSPGPSDTIGKDA